MNIELQNQSAVKNALPIIIAQVKEDFLNNLPPYLTILERGERITALNQACTALKKIPMSYFVDA
jgi:hypothetical protein